MSEDPILERLDEILGRHFPSGPLDPVTGELRALLADVAIEYQSRVAGGNVLLWDDEIRARFGVASSEEPKP